jgi:hypothetical protein
MTAVLHNHGSLHRLVTSNSSFVASAIRSAASIRTFTRSGHSIIARRGKNSFYDAFAKAYLGEQRPISTKSVHGFVTFTFLDSASAIVWTRLLNRNVS